MKDLTVEELLTRVGERLGVVEKKLDAATHFGDLRVDPITTYLAEAGGKRMRPALALLCGYLGPEPESERVEHVAVAMELTHLASLYHDDVMDEAPLRRGVPAAHRNYGNSAAIMAGDILFSRASSMMADLGARAVKDYAETFRRLCTGQLLETVGRTHGVSPRAHYLEVLAGKTGSLIAASAREGVFAAAGNREAEYAPVAARVQEFGENVGIAFQIADDYIDVVSEETGKEQGTDLRESVDTMPTILLRERAAAGILDDDGRAILAELDRGELAGQRLDTVLEALRNHSVMEETRALAEEWAARAVAAIADLENTAVREALTQYARSVVDRTV